MSTETETETQTNPNNEDVNGISIKGFIDSTIAIHYCAKDTIEFVEFDVSSPIGRFTVRVNADLGTDILSNFEGGDAVCIHGTLGIEYFESRRDGITAIRMILRATEVHA